jgi:signal transduction histidine kinase
MTMAPNRPKAALLLFAPFLLIAVLFAAASFLSMRRVSAIRANAQEVVEDMLADVELLSGMRRDLDRIEIMADQHVFEKEDHFMRALEARIALSEASFIVAAVHYESKPNPADERALWQEVKSSVDALRPRLDDLIELSRRNDDERAFAMERVLDEEFDRIHAAMGSLVQMNHRAAEAVVARVGFLQRSSARSPRVLSIVGVALSVVVGMAMTRLLQLRERQVRRYAGMLESSNRDLEAFAGRVAHDLRGPLSTASLATSRLATVATSPEQRRTIDVLGRSFGRMDAIIQDLLAISRVRVSEPAGACDPFAAAEQLREELAPRAATDDVSLVIDVQHASVRCSEGLLRQVMWNLADNAMKYRRADVRSRVEICGRAVADAYELSVLDNGVGISPDETGKVFEPFYRAGGGRGEAGTGLGLSIVKRVVEANGGTISVTSEPGTGSKFVTHLPLASD